MNGSERAVRLLRHATEEIDGDARALLAPLQEYDDVHNGDLLRTLHTYLANSGNASATAEALFLHRSGLLYRIRRIEALLGFGLDVFEQRTAVEIAVIALEESRRQ